MAINPGEEFRIKATPSPELLRRLAYLAAQDNDAVMTGLKSTSNGPRSADETKRRADALMLARLADPAYLAMSERINDKLDSMDEASVHALQEIEQELQDFRKKREKMLEQAYRDEQGKAIFMTKDASAAYYEDGSKVEDDEFGSIKDRLHGKPAWDDFDAIDKHTAELSAERDQIHRHDEQRQELREDVAQGAISKEEAKLKEQEIEATMPDRMRLSAEEEAMLNARATSPEPAGTQPAEGQQTAPVVPFQPK